MTGHSTSVLTACALQLLELLTFFYPPKKGHSSPLLFGPCLLWPNGRPSQLLDVIVSSKWCGGSVAQFVNDNWVLDLNRRGLLLTLLTLEKNACSNKVADFIATFMTILVFQNATIVLGSLTMPGSTGGAYMLQQGQNLHSGKSHKSVKWTFCGCG